MTKLLEGKRALIMGVANERSIAWGIANEFAKQGAELAFTFQGENLERRVRPLAESVGSNVIVEADVTDDASLDNTFAAIKDAWGGLDILVHAIAYSDKDELTAVSSIPRARTSRTRWIFPATHWSRSHGVRNL